MKQYIKDTVISTVISMIITMIMSAIGKQIKNRKDKIVHPKRREVSSSVRIYEDEIPVKEQSSEISDLKADAINHGYWPVKY